jgi:ABC-type Fe3+-hydroxamate transport system substrate-binding protein
MSVFTDMTGYQITATDAPKRIVSLVPSQTELLYALGLDAEVVGITKFCVHPESWFRSKKRIGGTKTVHMDIMAELQPDLVLANKEENTKNDIEQLRELYPVWTSDIQNVPQALEMVRQVGALTGTTEKALNLANEIQQGVDNLAASARPLRVAYFIWRNPWMCAGGDTFISDMITRMGWLNVLAGVQRYPEVSMELLKDLQPELLLLSSEPYPFKEKHIAELQQVLPGSRIMLVDGELFSWYGSRMLYALPYLTDLMHQLQ